MKTRQPTVIAIYKIGGVYRATISGHFGGGGQNIFCGRDEHAAAGLLISYIWRYGRNNPLGYHYVAPPEIKNLIPAVI
jgi:hypothetical protein